jgi:hypothetical protein
VSHLVRSRPDPIILQGQRTMGETSIEEDNRPSRLRS